MGFRINTIKKGTNMFRKGTLLSILVSMFACQGAEQAQKRSEKRQSFNVAIERSEKNLNLAQVELVIDKIIGGFIGCNDQSWSIEGDKGTVFASEECQSVTYEQLTFREQGNTTEITLKANSEDTYRDSYGISWRFLFAQETGLARLVSSFDATFEEGINVQNSRFNIEVAVDHSGEAICDAQKPFSITSSGGSRVMISLNSHASGAVSGVEFIVDEDKLAEGSPKPEVMATGFEINFSAYAPDEYVYENVMIAQKGESSCRVVRLTVNLQSEATAWVVRNSIELTNSFSMLTGVSPDAELVVKTLKDQKHFLPESHEIGLYSHETQFAITELAGSNCFTFVNDEVLRNTLNPTINFDLPPEDALSFGGLERLIEGMLTKFLPNYLEDDLQTRIILEELVKDLLDLPGYQDATATKTIAAGACTALLSSPANVFYKE